MNPEKLRFALEMAKVSKATYAGPINHRLYTNNGVPFSGQKIIHGSFGRGYCRVFWNEAAVTIGFRGTREKVDWAIANFKAYPVSLRDCQNTHKILVHRGFQNTLDYGDKTTELRSLDAVFGYLEEFDLLDRKISITGHSMGAALALLFAVKLRAQFPREVEDNLEAIVTFAGPSVGLKDFKKFYGELAEKTVRFVNATDIVPFAPPVLYNHVGEEVWLGQEGARLNVGWKARLRTTIKSCFVSSVGDHAISRYIKKIEKELEGSAN